jgi:hypothetical protein
VIDRQELFRWLNSARDWDDLIRKSDAFAELIGDGLLEVQNCGSDIVGLVPTSAGMARMPLVLPAAQS